MIRIFISYAHADEALRQELGKHLMSLKHQGLVEVWHDRLIGAGEEWARTIDGNLREAEVILLLISADFIASRYCYEFELQEALRRHDAGDAVVVPVILRPCEWHALPFGKLQAATRDGRPIVKFPTLDEGFFEVIQSIKSAAMQVAAHRRLHPSPSSVGRLPSDQTPNPAIRPIPRSSNLNVKRTFNDHDRDQFRIDAFEYIATFFENSLRALAERNSSVKTQFRRRDSNSFEAAAYQDGRQVARCGIWMSANRFGGDIAFSHSGLGSGNSYNESMSVADDGHVLGMKPLGISHLADSRNQILTLEGAAEFLWAMFVKSLQHE